MAAITANTSALGSDVLGAAANSLAAGSFCVTSAIDLSATDPLDALVQVEVTPGTVSGNKQVLVYAKVSLDGTAYSTGPESGSTATDEPNLFFLGALPLNSNATLQRDVFSVAAALGFVPPYMKVVLKNDSGVALAASGHSVKLATQAGVSA